MSRPKFIRAISDIHLDFDVENGWKFLSSFKKPWRPEPLPTDKETALLLAGDIWHAKKSFDFRGTSWIAEISKQFQYVIIVLGNHDFWGGDINEEYNSYRNNIARQNLKNVYILQNSALYFPGLKILGATLWTDFNDGCFNVLESAATNSGMRDYLYISNKGNKLSSEKLFIEHQISKEFIFEEAMRDYPEQKIIVVTHHSPSHRSAPKELFYPGNEMELAMYHSNLDEKIIKTEIDLWVHGHSHRAVDYTINKTRILSNPRGYVNEDTGFNPWQVIEVRNLHTNH